MMENKWFAGNFCPIGSKCNDSGDRLKPIHGPLIRTMEDFSDIPYLGEIRQFQEAPIAGNIVWMKAEGQDIGLQEYIALYPIIGYLYGAASSRAVFPLPNLSEYRIGYYYICVKGGKHHIDRNLC